MHAIDRDLTDALAALHRAQKPCYAIGLTKEMNATADALFALHRRLKELYEAAA